MRQLFWRPEVAATLIHLLPLLHMESDGSGHDRRRTTIRRKLGRNRRVDATRRTIP
jgi:hypothetical protein